MKAIGEKNLFHKKGRNSTYLVFIFFSKNTRLKYITIYTRKSLFFFREKEIHTQRARKKLFHN
jgi:hypothetical protein